MCGIIGAISKNNISAILIEGLRRLEYRGYDSCGAAISTPAGLQCFRTLARVQDLQQQMHNADATLGIAHTRWATHGAARLQNAHPLTSHEQIVLVHNGIIENYASIREVLKQQGYQFLSDTDTEVIAHLIHFQQQNAVSLLHATQKAVAELRGAFAIAVIDTKQSDVLIGARQGSPLIAGVGKNANFLASDTMALAGVTEQFIYLEDGDVIQLRTQSIEIYDIQGRRIERRQLRIPPTSAITDLGPYRHYMQKEIFEQPRVLADTIHGADESLEVFGESANTVHALQDCDSVLFLACGTSYYASMIAAQWLESLAKIPARVEIASEYRYRQSVLHSKQLIVVVSQSGETADTVAALKHAHGLGAEHSLAICNVAHSQLTRLAKHFALTHAGIEVGVASTKAMTTQLVLLYLLALHFAKLRVTMNAAQRAQALEKLRHLPAAVTAVLALEPAIISWAELFAKKSNAIFLGRGVHYPVALEGALKMKEISYIHAEAYPAGELKHGPLALVDEYMPVLTVAPSDELWRKLMSNMQEVHARGAELFVLTDRSAHLEPQERMHLIRMPEHYGMLSPVLHIVVLQLLAYHTAVLRGTDVDKPRNLAKSVTVE